MSDAGSPTPSRASGAMAERSTRSTPFRWPWLAVIVLLYGGSRVEAVDLNGRWRFEMTGAFSGSQIAPVTQVGNAVSVTLSLPPLIVDFTGTTTATTVSLQADPADVPCPTSGSLRVFPGASRLDGRCAACSAPQA